MPPDTLKAVRFNGGEIHSILRGTDNLTDAVEKILEAQMAKKMNRSDYDEKLLELLYILAPSRGVKKIKSGLEGWGFWGLYSIIFLARKYDLRDLSVDFLDMLKRGAVEQVVVGFFRKYKDSLIELLERWGYERQAIDDAILAHCFAEERAVSEVAVREYGYDEQREPSRRVVDLLIRAVKDKKSAVAYLGLGALKKNERLLPLMTQEDVCTVVDALALTDRDEPARETLQKWLKIPHTRHLVLLTV